MFRLSVLIRGRMEGGLRNLFQDRKGHQLPHSLPGKLKCIKKHKLQEKIEISFIQPKNCEFFFFNF